MVGLRHPSYSRSGSWLPVDVKASKLLTIQWIEKSSVNDGTSVGSVQGDNTK
jgi:hypothetical protein